MQKFYKSDAMQTAQKLASGSGVKWVRVHVPTSKKVEGKDENRDSSSAVHDWIDSKMLLTKAYKVNRFPQVVVLDQYGVIAYHGGVDSIRSSKVEDVARAKSNYLLASIQTLSSGKRNCKVPYTRPYGCSIKTK